MAELRSQGEIISDDLLAHVVPLGWEHITFNGDYVCPMKPLQQDFRPLRNPRSAFLASIILIFNQFMFRDNRFCRDLALRPNLGLNQTARG